jgi:hypothetical protein
VIARFQKSPAGFKQTGESDGRNFQQKEVIELFVGKFIDCYESVLLVVGAEEQYKQPNCAIVDDRGAMPGS